MSGKTFFEKSSEEAVVCFTALNVSALMTWRAAGAVEQAVVLAVVGVYLTLRLLRYRQ